MAGRRGAKVHLTGADALLLVDVLNDLEFPGGDRVLPWAERLVRPLRSLCARIRKAGLPVIYVNDNFGLWRGNSNDVYRHSTRRGARGREVARRLRPAKTDYVVLKPRQSGFFATPLLPLLEEVGARRLVIAGIATNLCVLATAHDATMHHFSIVVLSDCSAAETDFDHNVVLSQLEKFFHATICKSTEVSIGKARSRRRGAGRSHAQP